MKKALAGILKACTLLIVLCAWAAGGTARPRRLGHPDPGRLRVGTGSRQQRHRGADAAIAGSLMQAVVLSAMEILSRRDSRRISRS
jgi:hypothetical protein